MQIKTEAFVIHSLRYGESDLIVKLYTKKEGASSYLIRAVLKSKKGKIRASFFQLLSLLDIDAIHNSKGSLNSLKEAKPTTHYKSLHTNVIKGSIVTFIAEILNQVLIDNQPDEDLFNFIMESTNWLDQNEKTTLFPHFFLIKLSRFLGFFPDITNNTLPQFDLVEGKFDITSKSGYYIHQEELINFKIILGTDFDNLISNTISKSGRVKLLENLLLYFSLHIEGFKKPKSLNVIQELFS